MLKIALFGYGKMGRLIEKIAPDHNCAIVAIASQNRVPTEEQFKAADLFLDFSHSSQVMSHLELGIRYKRPLIIGTTGWEEHLDDAKKRVKHADIGVLYSPNFSLGVCLFLSLLSSAKELFQPFNEYDRAGIECHHRTKADAPSGTAKKISALFDHDLEWGSIRCGHIPGTHTVVFDSQGDTIKLSHEARNRDGFAIGALKAAHWIKDKKGWRTMDEMVRTFYSTHHTF
jgi:4-hydroxy-tetrahydrodipicolinate reductase